MAFSKYLGVNAPFFLEQWIGASESAQTVTTTGTTQAAGIVLAATMVQATPAAGSGSVNLPPAKAGVWLLVRNLGGVNALAIFASLLAASDTINGTIGTTALSVAAGKNVLMFCPADGTWFSLLGA